MPPVDDPTADRAAVAIWVALAVLAVSRAALAFAEGTWLWSLNLHRFLSPVAGWGLWLVAALTLLPPLARWLAPPVAVAGEALARRPGIAIAWAAAAAALAWLAPDRVRFVGDFLLRQGTVEVADRPGVLFPQALPLDVLLHYHLPLKLIATGWMSANTAARLMGAIEAGMLGALACGFARALDLRGGAAFACAAVVLFGGYLGMFTGFSKAFSEMCVLMAAAGVCGMAAVRGGRGLFTMGLVVAVGIGLHRSALGLLPALALVWGLWLARHGRAGAWRQPEVIAAASPPLLALLLVGPRIIDTVLHTDTAVHFTPPEVQAQGGVLTAMFARTRLLDMASLALLFTPLVIAAPFLAWRLAAAIGRQPGRWREPLVLVTMALPFLVMMAFIHPAQGTFRDWDDFAATGVATSLLTAWLVGETLRAARRFAWIAVAVALGVAVPAVQWLVVHADIDRGLARVRAFVLEPPPRPGVQRGTTWDYLGIRNYRLGRYAEAQEALARAVETTPSPRVLHEWALAATMAGDLRTAQRAYQLMLGRRPESAEGWLGLLAVSMRLRDVPEAKRAATELRKLEPAHPDARRALADIARYEALQADSVRRILRR